MPLRTQLPPSHMYTHTPHVYTHTPHIPHVYTHMYTHAHTTHTHHTQSGGHSGVKVFGASLTSPVPAPHLDKSSLSPVNNNWGFHRSFVREGIYWQLYYSKIGSQMASIAHVKCVYDGNISYFPSLPDQSGLVPDTTQHCSVLQCHKHQPVGAHPVACVSSFMIKRKKSTKWVLGHTLEHP